MLINKQSKFKKIIRLNQASFGNAAQQGLTFDSTLVLQTITASVADFCRAYGDDWSVLSLAKLLALMILNLPALGRLKGNSNALPLLSNLRHFSRPSEIFI